MSDVKPRVTVVIPAYNEGSAIIPHLRRMLESITLPCEILIVVDTEDDTTLPPVREYALAHPALRVIVSAYGRGPARAIRFGFDQATAPVVVVTMADGCDDPQQIDALTLLVERGVVIAAASRYMRGGQQVGGPPLKGMMSRTAGRSLQWFARVGTHDATNSFKAYNRDFVREVGIESDSGFEIGIELVAKARRRRLPVAEIPTIWLDRSFGESNFKTKEWLPRYLRWYVHAYGPKDQGE
ncbi:MAG: glycosyltransferase [Thermoleophilia bacterium]|nr:glycosyltransferase [Thermoleophilia bacterium]